MSRLDEIFIKTVPRIYPWDEALKQEFKTLLMELIIELNGGDWSKPINSDDLRQKVDVL